MEIEILGVMIPIIAIIGGYIMIVYLRKYQNEERMAMIEKGVDMSIFANERKSHSVSGTLRASLLLIGAGIGLLLGYYLDYNYNMEEVAYFSMLFIFGGLGLGAAYVIELKKMKSDA